jgi:hypothetical protein
MGLKIKMDRFTVRIAYNGEIVLSNIQDIQELPNANDKSMVKDLGEIFYWLYCKRDLEIKRDITGKIISTKINKAGLPNEVASFLQRTTCPMDEYCLKQPLSDHPFVRNYLHTGEFQPRANERQQNLLRPMMNAVKLVSPDAKVCVPLPYNDPRKYIPPEIKTTLLIDQILKHMASADRVSIAKSVEVIFAKRNGVGDFVSDSHIIEAWKGFLEQHSMWAAGPCGFYLLDGKEPCWGCGTSACKFRSDHHCLSIGKWIANTLLRPSEIPIPLPFDPVFLQTITRTVCFFDGVTPDTAADEYERIVAGRETQLAKMQQGLLMAEELDHLNGTPISVIMSWLFSPSPIDRAELMKNIIATQEGEDQECLTWFMDWFYECTEMDLRWFLVEVTGSPIPRPSKIYVNISGFFRRSSTDADICQGIFIIPATNNKDLFLAMLTFSGPFFFNK